MNKNLLEKKVAAVDAQHLDPEERAELVHAFIFQALDLSSAADFIEHPLYWDLLCYCTSMLSLWALASEDPELLVLMKTLNSHIHSLHYAFSKGSPQLGPSRREHEKIWNDRIEGFI
jgi:hypothetical protein